MTSQQTKSRHAQNVNHWKSLGMEKSKGNKGIIANLALCNLRD